MKGRMEPRDGLRKQVLRSRRAFDVWPLPSNACPLSSVDQRGKSVGAESLRGGPSCGPTPRIALRPPIFPRYGNRLLGALGAIIVAVDLSPRRRCRTIEAAIAASRCFPASSFCAAAGV